jgi:hypothetical protein
MTSHSQLLPTLKPTKTQLVRNDSPDGTLRILLTLPFETVFGSSSSQHTSSDELSALPSDYRSSAVATGARHRTDPSERVGSGVERYTPPRQRVSFDSGRGPSTGPRPSKLSSAVGF